MANHGQRGERLPGDWECRCGRYCYAARAVCSVCSRHYSTRVGEVPLLPGQVKCANDGCREVVHADRQGDCLFCGRYTPVPAAPYRQHQRQQRAQQDPLAYWRGLSSFQQDEQFGRLERWIVRVLRALPAEDLHFGNRRGPVPYLLRTGGGLVHCLRLRQLESWFIGPQGEVERLLLLPLLPLQVQLGPLQDGAGERARQGDGNRPAEVHVGRNDVHCSLAPKSDRKLCTMVF